MFRRKMQFMCLLPLLLGLIGCFSPSNESTPGSEGSNSETSGSSSSKVRPTSVEEGEIICETYMNPVSVKTSNNNPFTREVCDPSVVRDGEDFYCFATNDVVLHSTDGCNWKEYAKTNAKWQWAKDEQPGVSYALWAPDAIKINGTWYYYYSISGTSIPKYFCGIGYMTSDSLGGPWANERKLFWGNDLSPKVENCIDPHIIVDDDGRIYCTVGSFLGTYMVELQENNGTLSLKSSTATLINGRPGHGWEGNQFEGHYIIKKDGYYYYFGSHGTCCKGLQGDDPRQFTYRVAVGRSTNIMGPYVDANNNRLLDSYGSSQYGTLCLVADGVDTFAPGHNSIFLDDDGEYWIYYHAYTTDDNLVTRHLMVDHLSWDSKGFPHVDGKSSNLPSFQEEREGPYIYNRFE